MTTFDDAGCEVLDESTCMELLGIRTLGRLALTENALPVILPVAYAMAGRCPVMKLGEGAVRRAAEQEAVTCFEVDDVDARWRWAWSVAVIGRLRVVEAPRHSPDGDSGIPTWEAAGSTAPVWAELIPHRISGRRYGGASRVRS